VNTTLLNYRKILIHKVFLLIPDIDWQEIQLFLYQLFQNQSQIDGLNIIRKFGNSAAHVLKNVIDNTTKTLTLDRNIALNCLKGLFDFTLWIGYCYGSTLQTDDIKYEDYNYNYPPLDLLKELLQNNL